MQFGPSPVAHTTGLVTSVLVPMLVGASTHLMAEWEPARGIEEIQRFGCTAAVTAPTFLHGLLSEYDAERHDLSRLRLWVCAGAPIPAAVVERASATLPNIKVLSLYGRSENLVTTTLFRRRRCVAGPDIGWLGAARRRGQDRRCRRERSAPRHRG